MQTTFRKPTSREIEAAQSEVTLCTKSLKMNTIIYERILLHRRMAKAIEVIRRSGIKFEI